VNDGCVSYTWYLATDVSEKTIGSIFKRQARPLKVGRIVRHETSVADCYNNIPEEKMSHQ